MTRLTDEQLLAYADGELPEADRAVVEEQIMSVPELKARLEVLTSTGRNLARYYEEPMRRPAPDHLIDLVLTYSPNDRDAEQRKSRELKGASARPPLPSSVDQSQTGKWRRIFDIRSYLPSANGQALAYAATLGLCFLIGRAVGTGSLSSSSDHAPRANEAIAMRDGQMIAGSALHDALETQPSSSTSPTAEHALQIIYTFPNKAGGFCRQYEMTIRASKSASGVACRDPSGAWIISGHFAGAERRRIDEREYQTAAGSKSRLVDQIVEQLIDGDVLSGDDEQLLLDKQWPASTKP